MTKPTSHIKFELDRTMNEILERCLKYSTKNPGLNHSEITEIVEDATTLKKEIATLIKDTEQKKNKQSLSYSLQYIQNELQTRSSFIKTRIEGLYTLV